MQSSDNIKGAIVLRVVLLVERHIRYLILLSLCGFEQICKRPRRWTPLLLPMRAFVGAVYWTRNMTLLFHINLWVRIVGGFFFNLAFLVRFPPGNQRTFPWFPSLFPFLWFCFPSFFRVYWWSLQFFFLSMLLCFLQELVKAKRDRKTKRVNLHMIKI